MTCEELQTIIKNWEEEERDEIGWANDAYDGERYEYSRGKLAAFKMIVELLQKKEKNNGK